LDRGGFSYYYYRNEWAAVATGTGDMVHDGREGKGQQCCCKSDVVQVEFGGKKSGRLDGEASMGELGGTLLRYK
jgi:hypothetical protein